LAAAGVSSDGRIVVYVGGCNPHKNLEVLLSAFARLVKHEGYADAQLVMVGDYQNDVFHGYFETIQRQVERDGLVSRVIFTGYLPDDELVVLLNLASVLVLPSLMEGYGLPAVEAAACACPVIATRESPLPDLLGEGGVYIDPRAPDELYLALEMVLGSERRRHEMGCAGVRAVRRLSWDVAAHQMDDVLRQVTRR
jgi:glycosyltransferase involved in cell wall biosynthesis